MLKKIVIFFLFLKTFSVNANQECGNVNAFNQPLRNEIANVLKDLEDIYIVPNERVNGFHLGKKIQELGIDTTEEFTYTSSETELLKIKKFDASYRGFFSEKNELIFLLKNSQVEAILVRNSNFKTIDANIKVGDNIELLTSLNKDFVKKKYSKIEKKENLYHIYYGIAFIENKNSNLITGILVFREHKGD